MKNCFSLLLFLLFSCFVFSQDYSTVDAKVKKYPKHFISFKSLATQISNDFDNETDQVRALYYWVSNNILYDYNHDLLLSTVIESDLNDINYGTKLKENYAKTCLKKNIGVCEGYSLIIKYTLDLLNIENKIIRGYAKTGIQDIENISDVKNHAWSAVKINNSWKLMDATWSTGLTETNRTNFCFNELYFLVEPESFILSHFPERKEFQFLSNPKAKRAFFFAPIVYSNYYWSKLKSSNNLSGLFRVKPNEKISITFENIDKTKTYYYQFLGAQEYFILKLNKRNNLYISNITYTGNKDTRLTIYENKDPIMSFKIKTK